MKRGISVIMSVLLLAAFLVTPATAAAEKQLIMNAFTQADSLAIFMKDDGRGVDSVYIGNAEMTNYDAEEVAGTKTIVLVDNSLSTNEENREKINVLLSELVAARNPGDVYSIATFSHQISYLIQESSDYLQIKQAIDNIQYVQQETYLSKSLYSVIDAERNLEHEMFTRIVIIADGEDHEALGYTQEELNSLIEEAHYPIYVIGCDSGENEEKLKSLFAIARLSNADSYLLDSVEPNAILQSIISDEAHYKLVIHPDQKLCDGSKQTMRIVSGEEYDTIEITMPFVANETKSTAKPVEGKSAQSANPVKQTTQPAENTQEKKAAFPVPTVVIIAAIAVIVLGGSVAAVLIILKNKKKKKNAAIGAAAKPMEPFATTVIEPQAVKSAGGTTVLSGHSPQTSGESHTMVLGSGSLPSISLQDLQMPGVVYEYPIRERVLIGRSPEKCQIVIQNHMAVSSVHCEIVVRSGNYYVRDGGADKIQSTNGTFVNGKRATPELQLISGCTLKLGDAEFKLTLK